jgi:outer membrane protein
MDAETRMARALRGARGLLWGGACALALATGGPARAETLTDALIGAYRSSGLLEQNRALLRAADEDVASAVAALYPVLQYLAQADQIVNRNDGFSADATSASVGITAQMPLWSGGRNRLAIDAAKETVLATRAALLELEQQVLLRAVTAFFGVLRQQEFVALRQNGVRLVEEELRAAGDRFEVGEITRTDVSLAEARLEESRSFLAEAQGDLVDAREEYLAVVGRYPSDLRVPQIPMRPVASVDEARAIALRNHPSIEEAQRNVTAGEIAVLVQRAQRRPQLLLEGEASVADGGEGRQRIGVQLSGPIYSGGAIASGVRRAVAQVESLRAALLVETEVVRQDVAIAFSNLRVAQATLEARRRQAEAQEVAFEGAREEATLGARTTLDVLDAEQDLLDARTNVVAADTAQFIAAYQLLSAMGLLTVTDLNLGITQYDPEAYYDAVRTAPAQSPQGRALDRVLKRLGSN